MEKYDLIVIGGGPGGYVAAIRAAQLGFRTALVERDKLGGTCLNRGCIPTKALLHSAAVYAERNHYDALGLHADNFSYDMGKIHARKDEVVEKLRNGVEGLLKSNKIDIMYGSGKVIEPKIVEACDIQYHTEKILIATGSSPSRIPIQGIDLQGVVTSNDILEGPVRDYRRLIIIGGGVIGVEMASFYAALGCKVTIIEAMERLIPLMEREISQNLTMILKKRGVEIYCGATVNEIVQNPNGDLSCRFIQKEETKSAEAEGVLISIGRKPNTTDLFAPESEPETEKGFIKVNDKYESSIEGILAIGDVIGGVQLAHKAEAEGIAAVEILAGHEPETDPRFVPSCIYTDPEIASVGLTPDEAKTQGIATKTAKYVMSGNGKSIIEMQERGFIKMTFDTETERLLGVQMMCARATDLISEYTGMILNGVTRHRLLKGMRPHPSFCEGLTEAIEAAEGHSIHSAPVR